jgi:cytochrome c oxidase assembly factor CtaG
LVGLNQAEVAFLHAGHNVDLAAWHLEPTVVAGAFIVLSFYLYGMTMIQGAFVPWRAVSFCAGTLVFFIALVSPLDTGADRLLSLHMLQHVLLATIGPPLLLLGLTPPLLAPLFRNGRILQAAHLATHPVFAGALLIVNMWFWHIPPVYSAAADSLGLHIVMHLAFMVSGLLFWWPVVQPLPAIGRYGEGARLLYLFATGMPMALLAMLLLASGGVIYEHYETVQPLWGIDPKQDQQVAGLIMGGLGEAASFVAVTLLFFRFLDRDEAEAAAPPVQGRINAR